MDAPGRGPHRHPHQGRLRAPAARAPARGQGLPALDLRAAPSRPRRRAGPVAAARAPGRRRRAGRAVRVSPRALGRLVLAFAALAAVYGGWTALDARSRRPKLLYPAAAQARSLAVGGVRLEKGDGAWSLTRPFAAPAEGVDAALAELAAARVSAPLSDDPARLPLFALQDSSATRLEVEGATPLSLLLGGPGADPDSVFVREPGSPVVREVDGLSRGRWSADPGAWADKTLVSLEAARVTKVSVRSPKGAVAVDSKDPRWPKLKPLLDALAKFSADSVGDVSKLEAEPRVRLERVEFSLEVETLDYKGDPATLSFTVSPIGQDFRHLAKVKGRDSVVYSLAGWRLDPLRLDPKDFR
ncbi:DUF4340 domain-containing protein [bacterium]|nr:MAG: DUF4340 domain-containing protein [bacterium]